MYLLGGLELLSKRVAAAVDAAAKEAGVGSYLCSTKTLAGDLDLTS